MTLLRPLWVSSVVGLVLAVFVLSSSYTEENGMDGPCDGTGDWVRAPERVGYQTFTWSLWPPGRPCRVYTRSGELLGEKVYPESSDWVPAGAAFLAAFPLVAGYRWYRRRRRWGRSVA